MMADGQHHRGLHQQVLTAVWNMLTHHTTYAELGGDYYTRRDPMRAKDKAIRQLEALGYQVIVQPAVP